MKLYYESEKEPRYMYATIIRLATNDMLKEGFSPDDFFIKIENDRLDVYLLYKIYGTFVEEFVKSYHLIGGEDNE